MKNSIPLYLSIICLFLISSCQTKSDQATNAPSKQTAETPTPKKIVGQDPKSSNFNFEAALANYNQGQHGDLVDYLNSGITEVNRAIPKIKGADQMSVKNSLDALKILAVKVRRTDFKHPQVLENAIARMEMNQAHNFLFISKHQAADQVDQALISLKKSITKMEHATVRFKGSLKEEADQLLRTHKDILSQGEEKTPGWEKALDQQISKMGEWLKTNSKDLGIVI